MASRIMMMLGAYMFSLSTATYEQLTRSNEYRWPSQERIGRSPALQFVGAGPESVKLSGTIYPHFKGGTYQVSLMRLQAGLGRPLILVDGTGMIWGKYAIKRIEETRSVFFANGQPRKIEFSLDLERYVGDSYGFLSV